MQWIVSRSVREHNNQTDANLKWLATSLNLCGMLLYPGVLHQRRFIEHLRCLEAREVYYCLASWSVYLSELLTVEVSMDHTEK
jgi:hypothetical protein